MATRTRYNGASVGVRWQDQGATEGLGNQLSRLLGALMDEVVWRLWNTTGTNAYASTLTYELEAGLKSGMKFLLYIPAANTGACTLSINGGSALPLLDAQGFALTGGELKADQIVIIHYGDGGGGGFRILGLVGTKDIGLGAGQAWITPSRTNGTTYQNTTGRPIMVTVTGDNSLLLQVSADNSTWATVGQCSGTSNQSVGAIIPNGHWYRTQNGVLASWAELR